MLIGGVIVWITFSDDHCYCYFEKNPSMGERWSRVYEGRWLMGVHCDPAGRWRWFWRSGEVGGAGCILKAEPTRVVGNIEGD